MAPSLSTNTPVNGPSGTFSDSFPPDHLPSYHPRQSVRASPFSDQSYERSGSRYQPDKYFLWDQPLSPSVQKGLPFWQASIPRKSLLSGSRHMMNGSLIQLHPVHRISLTQSQPHCISDHINASGPFSRPHLFSHHPWSSPFSGS